MKTFIYSLMTDKKKGAIFAPFKAVLFILSLIYGCAIFLRKIFYRLHIFNTRHAPLKVISVGNISLGGTGKTPFVIMLARLLENEMGRNVCVLIRGYGWDEQAMLKKNLIDIPVMVGEDRLRSANKACKLYGSDTAVLDDGFQHWELFRDLNIVLVDSRNPFGNDCLFPRGILRENKKELRRADVIVFTKANIRDGRLNSLMEEVRYFNDRATICQAAHVPANLYDNKTKKAYALDYLKTKNIILLSSIGDPAYFEETVRGLGGDIVEHMKFPDHHDYIKGDVDNLIKRCNERRFDFVLTTEKDAVKLGRLGFYLSGYAVLVLSVRMDINAGREELIARLHSLYTG